jgi:stress-induced morphogen
MHAEHAAMRDSGYNETHFRVLIVSEKFKGKMPVMRHRMVYSLLTEEFENGLHAVNIIAKTPEEYPADSE